MMSWLACNSNSSRIWCAVHPVGANLARAWATVLKVVKAATTITFTIIIRKPPCLMLKWTSLPAAKLLKPTNLPRWSKVWQKRLYPQTQRNKPKTNNKHRKRSNNQSVETAKCACNLSSTRIATSKSVTLRSRNEKRLFRSSGCRPPKSWLSHRRRLKKPQKPIKQWPNRNNRRRLRSHSSFRRCAKGFSRHRWWQLWIKLQSLRSPLQRQTAMPLP